MESNIDQAVKKIQYAWKLYRVRNVLNEAFNAEIKKKSIKSLKKFKQVFRAKFRKHYIDIPYFKANLCINKCKKYDKSLIYPS